MRRWLRRIGLAIFGLLLAITFAAIGFDFATRGDSRPATALYKGPFAWSATLSSPTGGGVAPARRSCSSAAPPSHQWVWHDVGPRLAARHHVVFAIDLPPFGFTERRGPYTLGGWIALLRGFEQRLGIHRPLIVGHSLGAGVAVAAALGNPAGVAGIVLLDGDALPFGHGRGFITHMLVYPYYPALYRLLTGSDWLVSRVLRNAWGPNPPHFSHDVLANFERPFRVAGTENALKQLASGGIPGVSLADLARVRVPRAVVWGAADNVDSVSSGKKTASALHVPLILVPRAGHLSMLANPKATAAAIEREDALAHHSP